MQNPTGARRAREPAWIAGLRVAADVPCTLGRIAAPWLDLAIRIWLAGIFLTGVAARMVLHEAPAMAGADRLAAAFTTLVATPVGLVVQTLCPFLLMFGLSARTAAVLLLVQMLALGGAAAPHPVWSVLLVWIIVAGPGTLSLDALLCRGLDTAAVPGLHRLVAAGDWVSRQIGPIALLLLRLWIAAALWAALDRNLDALRGVLAPTAPMLVPAATLALAVLLTIGLATRVSAILVAASVPLATGMGLDDHIYWLLALGLAMMHGAGPFSLDALIVAALRRGEAARDARHDDTDLPHVVIVGGGFGGTAAAHGLRRAPCRITLVDRRNYNLFQPLLYQVASAGLSPADIATPIRALFHNQDNVNVRLETVVGVDAAAHELLLDGGRLPYDMLVLATGSQHSYFGRDEWAALAPGLKRIEDATDIRRRLLIAFERAEVEPDAARRAAAMTFVIVGGGATGVELAGAIAELARHGLAHEFRVIDPADARIVLVQSAPHLLPTFPERLSIYAERTLRTLGVDVRLNAKVEAIDAGGVMISGERLAAETMLWAAGVQASAAGKWLGTAVDRAGRVVVGTDLAVPAHPDIFVIGDTAASDAWDGKPVPGLAPAAKQGGAYVARVMRARLDGRPAPAPFRYRHAGSLATIGRRAAVADFGFVRVHGALAWWLWGAVHIMFLVGARNRATVMLDWAWAYVTYRRGTRLITDAREMP